MPTQREIEQFLIQNGFVLPPQHWHWRYYGHPFSWRYPQPVTREDVAQDVLRLAEECGLKLGNWFSTTDGRIVLAAVQAVLPASYTAEIELLAEGLELAARIQQQRGIQRLAGPVTVGVLCICVGLVIANTMPRSA